MMLLWCPLSHFLLLKYISHSNLSASVGADPAGFAPTFDFSASKEVSFERCSLNESFSVQLPSRLQSESPAVRPAGCTTEDQD